VELGLNTYYLHAYVYDRAGNRARSNELTFLVDAVAPTPVSVTSPTHAASMTALTGISGAASDNPGGSGIARVEAYLRRKNSAGLYEYWGRRNSVWGWATTLATIPTTLSAPGASSTAWSVAVNSPAGVVLPAGAELRPGTYYPLAYAYDYAGNRTRSNLPAFKIVAATSAGIAGREAPQSTVSLSSATLNAAGDLVLNFSGVLDEAMATNASNYSVSVNGQSLDVEDMVFRNGVTVTLGLPLSLQTADKVSIRYNLCDRKKLRLVGETIITVK
jgi:hypothetical protein